MRARLGPGRLAAPSAEPRRERRCLQWAARVVSVPVQGAAGAAAGAAEAVGGGGAPVGNVGNLIVGEAVGLGGRLMRTVSFLG